MFELDYADYSEIGKDEILFENDIFIRDSWKDNPKWINLTENCNVDFIYQLRNKHASLLTNLNNGEMVTIEELYRDILLNGLQDPVVIRLNKKTKTIKLDSGNHRIIAYHRHMINEIPCTLIVVNENDDKTANGSHAFTCNNIAWDDLKEGKYKPSKYLEITGVKHEPFSIKNN